MGMGALAMPHAVHKSGVISTCVVFGSICVGVYFTSNLLIECALHIKCNSYEQLTKKILGNCGYLFLCLMCLMINIGAAITYILYIHAILDAEVSSFMNLDLFTIILCTAFCLPLCFVKDWESLAIISKIKTFVYIVVVLFVIIRGCTDNYYGKHYKQYTLSNYVSQKNTWVNIRGTFKSIGVFAFGSIFHDCMFPAYKSMTNQSLSAWKKTSVMTVTFTFCISMILGIAGAFNFRPMVGAVSDKIFTSKSDKRLWSNDGWFLFIRCILACLMLMTVPICIHVSREYLQSMIENINEIWLNSNFSESKVTINEEKMDVKIILHEQQSRKKSSLTIEFSGEMDSNSEINANKERTVKAVVVESEGKIEKEIELTLKEKIKSVFSMTTMEYVLSIGCFCAVLFGAIGIGDGNIMDVIDILGSYIMISIGFILPPVIYMHTFSVRKLFDDAQVSFAAGAKFIALWICILWGVFIWINETVNTLKLGSIF